MKADGPDDLVFQSVRDGKPIRDNNILSRFIKPAGRDLGMPWVNWRTLRTSHAVWLKLVGSDPGRSGPDAALAHFDNHGHLHTVCTRVTGECRREAQYTTRSMNWTQLDAN